MFMSRGKMFMMALTLLARIIHENQTRPWDSLQNVL